MNSFTRSIDSNTLAILRTSSYLSQVLNFADASGVVLKAGAVLSYTPAYANNPATIILPSGFFLNGKYSYAAIDSNNAPCDFIRALAHELGHAVDEHLAQVSMFKTMGQWVSATSADEVEAIYTEYVIRKEMPPEYNYSLSGSYLKNNKIIDPWTARFKLIDSKYSNPNEAKLAAGKIYAEKQQNMVPSGSIVDTYKTLAEKSFIFNLLGLRAPMQVPREYISYTTAGDGSINSATIYLGSHPDSPHIVNELYVSKNSSGQVSVYEVFKNTLTNTKVVYETSFPQWNQQLSANGETTWSTTLLSGQTVSFTEEYAPAYYIESHPSVDILYADMSLKSLSLSPGMVLTLADLQSGDIMLPTGAKPIYTREGTSLIVTFDLQSDIAESNTLTIEGWFTDGEIPAIAIWISGTDSSGISMYSGRDVTNEALNLIGTESADLLSGIDKYENHFTGGKGNDLLRGGGLSDIVSINAGDGRDTFVSNGGADIIELNGVQLTSLGARVDKLGNSLRVSFGEGTQLTISDWELKGESITFKDMYTGQTFDKTWIINNIVGFYGDSVANLISGNTLDNILYGLEGDDYLVGNGGE